MEPAGQEEPGAVEHSVHAVAALPGENLPGAHRVHLRAPVESENVPAEHGIALLLPPRQWWPERHGTPDMFALPAAQYVPGTGEQPAEHVSALVWPVVTENLPASHSVHAPEPVLFLYVPAPQTSHEAVPFGDVLTGQDVAVYKQLAAPAILYVPFKQT